MDTPKNHPNYPSGLLTLEAARVALGGISNTTLWVLRRSGELRTVRVGRRCFIEEAEVQRFISRSGAANLTTKQKAA